MTNTEKVNPNITAAKAQAEELGKDHGKASGTWVEFTEASAANCIKLDDDGDPEWHEFYGARAPLSGEMADSLTPALLLRELGLDPEVVTDVEESEICDVYEQAFFDAHRDEVLRSAAAYV